MNFSARTILAIIWGALIIAVFSAPLLLSESSSVAAFFAYLPFSFICHQIPERSFALLNYPLAVCHRCSGIYFGLFLGTLLSPVFFRVSPHARRIFIFSATAFLAFDALLPFTGLWSGFWLCRFLTGLVFGVAVAPFAVIGLDEILTQIFHADSLRKQWRHVVKRRDDACGGPCASTTP